MSETAPCLKCRSEISVEAERCPECSYEPNAEGSRGRWWFKTIGALLTMTVIGAVIGIPMLMIAWLGDRGMKDRKPTTAEP